MANKTKRFIQQLFINLSAYTLSFHKWMNQDKPDRERREREEVKFIQRRV